MTRIRKSYFTLEELASEWGLPEADLRYVAENGLLTLSIRVVRVFMELGYWEEFEDGERTSIPCERRYYDGVLDLHKQHVFSLFRDGVVEPGSFRQADGYASLWRDEDVIVVRPRDLLVRDDERQRFEAEVLPTLRVETTSFGDFTDFWHEGRRYRFTPTQAKVLRFLHEAALQREPVAVRQGGARRGRLALAQARRPLQAAAGVAGYRRRGRLRQSIASHLR